MSKHGEFEQAVKRGDSERIKSLLKDERVDPAAQDNYAIRRASRKGHTEVVKLLIQTKVTRGDPETIEIILNNIEDVNEKKEMKEFIENENKPLIKGASKKRCLIK